MYMYIYIIMNDAIPFTILIVGSILFWANTYTDTHKVVPTSPIAVSIYSSRPIRTHIHSQGSPHHPLSKSNIVLGQYLHTNWVVIVGLTVRVVAIVALLIDGTQRCDC